MPIPLATPGSDLRIPVTFMGERYILSQSAAAAGTGIGLNSAGGFRNRPEPRIPDPEKRDRHGVFQG